MGKSSQVKSSQVKSCAESDWRVWRAARNASSVNGGRLPYVYLGREYSATVDPPYTPIARSRVQRDRSPDETQSCHRTCDTGYAQYGASVPQNLKPERATMRGSVLSQDTQIPPPLLDGTRLSGRGDRVDQAGAHASA